VISPLVHLHCGDLLKYAGVEGHVQVERDAVQPLQAEYQLIKQELGLLVKGADESMSLIESE